ncbi:pilus assembly protein PilP [Halomonas sp. PAMB 3264]|uniref:pilus assembly protein PilP n=1 Tax=unclassified Halomonas TaxID=2609666 RepID=UPI00289E9BC8|nr:MULTISPECIES: pilus assembly protein PilP [unclassified Halomonas]WNL39677.1 pilus assembly protein PilP [Halomonas sp. PAMB 3232]WNL43037.1 pilus assembly protein PilP [Halomonas sp. PAMB 3264]
MSPRALTPLLLTALLSGCNDAMLDQLDATLADIRREPNVPVAIDAAPFPEPALLNYRYSESRSPFLAPERLARSETIATRNSALAPDTERPLEPLEAFALPSLRLVGTLQMGTQRVALIATPDGSVVTVREGNHLGTNYGEITRITLDEVTLVERILDEQQGWQTSPAALSLQP